MFTKNDLFDLDSAMQRVRDHKQNMELKLEIMALKLILEQKGILSKADIDACMTYLKTTQEWKIVSEQIQTLENNIEGYKQNPQKHLQDLFKAKLDGSL